jgi:hypothetical protein
LQKHSKIVESFGEEVLRLGAQLREQSVEQDARADETSKLVK